MPEDTPDKCCVCNKDQQSQSNRLLVCGNCAVTVHEGCYGVQKSTGLANWFCRKCESQVRISKIRCDLCPIKEGAFKRSGGSRCGWAHVLCAVYFPEAYFKDPETMDLIMLDNIPSDRYGRPCVFCERNQRTSQANHGACIQCSWTSCRTYFHVTCAWLAGLLSELPVSVTDSTESLAVALTKMSNRLPSDCIKSAVGSDGSLSTCNSAGQSEFVNLHGFCSIRHKEKFAEFVSQTTPGLTSSPANAKPASPPTTVEVTTVSSPGNRETLDDPPVPCPPLIHSTPTTLDGIDGHTEGRTAVGNAIHSTGVPEAKPQSPMGNSNEPFEPEDGRFKNRATRKNPIAEGAPKLSEPSAPKRPKTEASSQRDGETTAETDLFSTSAFSNGPVTSVPDSADPALPRLSPETKTVHSHPTGTLPTSTDDVTEQVSPATTVPMPKSSAPKSSRNRRGQKKSPHKPMPKSENASGSVMTVAGSPNSINTVQRNLPLTWPQRPVSIRGFGLPVKGADNKSCSGSFLSDLPNSTDTSNSSKCSSSGAAVQSPLTTMQDLLEWQWDQAGALLMQQVEGTDVVSLLDCLHQLKAENDSLEAKLVRLKTRQEHLRSVNARLAASLATMEAATVTMPSGEKLLTRTTQPLKAVTHEEAILYTPSTGCPQPTTHLNARSAAIHAPRGSPDQVLSGSPSLLTAVPTVHPNLSPITVGGVCSSSTLASPYPASTFQSPYHPSQSVDGPKQHPSWQAKNSGSIPSSSPTLNTPGNSNSSSGHLKQTRRAEPNSPNSKRSPKQWLGAPGSNELPLRTTDTTATANSTSLVELSARLSSAIAARQVNNSVQPSADLLLKGNCNSRRVPEYVPIAKNVVTAYQANRVPTTSMSHLESIPNSGLTPYSLVVSNHHSLAETAPYTTDRQFHMQGTTTTSSIAQQSGLSTTSGYLSSAGPSVPTPVLPSPSTPIARPFPASNADPLLSTSTLPNHSRS